jgi:excisionase family DNA binding protein
MADDEHRSTAADQGQGAVQSRERFAQTLIPKRGRSSLSHRGPRTGPVTRLAASDVMTGREVAELLHAPVSTVEDWARRDVLPSVKIGRRRLYTRQHIEAVLTGNSSF